MKEVGVFLDKPPLTPPLEKEGMELPHRWKERKERWKEKKESWKEKKERWKEKVREKDFFK